MVALIVVVACVLGAINVSNAGKVPSFITPCKTENDDECVKQNVLIGIPKFGAGIPELGLSPMDPLHMELIDASSPSLKLILKGIDLTGLKDCKPIKVQRNAAKSNMFLQLSCALTLDGLYEMDGKMMIFNLAGKGNIHVFIRELVINFDLSTVEKVGKDGEKHIRVNKFTHTYELKQKSDVVFSGLFEDNAVLSKSAADLFESSGNAIIREVGGGVFEAFIIKCVEHFNKFFAEIPTNQITIE